jgi:hypothetical protein
MAVHASRVYTSFHEKGGILMRSAQLPTATLCDGLGVEKHETVTLLSEFLDVTRFGNPVYDKPGRRFSPSQTSPEYLDVTLTFGPIARQTASVL